MIDGEIVDAAAAGGEAGSIGTMIGYHVPSHVLPHRWGQVSGVDGGFVLSHGQPNEMLRAADVAFVQTERVPFPPERVRFPRLTPDLAVEVVPPNDRLEEVAAKTAPWLESGVRLMWIVGPSRRTVAIRVPGQTMRVPSEGEELDGSDVLPDFRVPVAEIFV